MELGHHSFRGANMTSIRTLGAAVSAAAAAAAAVAAGSASHRPYSTNIRAAFRKCPLSCRAVRVRWYRGVRFDGRRHPGGRRYTTAPGSGGEDRPNHEEVGGASLPSQAEGRRSHAARRFSSLMDRLQSNVFVASQRLNDLTGYSGIEALKRNIQGQEVFVRQARQAVREAKEAYTNTIAQRSASQREVNELLQRKHAWSPADLERFTALYRSDHANEQAETKAGADLVHAERIAEEAGVKLSQSILARYHEEQIWSDKIRRMSTWGTWALMAVNVLLFIIFQVSVEPWRRRRLVDGFEEKVREAFEKEKMSSSSSVNVVPPLDTDRLESSLLGTDDPPIHSSSPEQDEEDPTITTTPPSPTSLLPPPPPPPPPPLDLSSLSFSFVLRPPTTIIVDLFSHRQVICRQVDLTSLALSSAATGAVITALVCATLLRIHRAW